MSSDRPNPSPPWRGRRQLIQARRAINSALRGVIRKTGYDVVPYEREVRRPYPVDFSEGHTAVIDAVRQYTMTPPERIYALIEAVDHIVQRQIPGSFVECGVWRGGSMMAAALTLRRRDCADRDLYLFDTFEGMPRPEAVDVDYNGNPAMATFASQQTGHDSSMSCFADLEDVRANMAKTEYCRQRIHLIKGKVEDTIPAQSPEQIALLRLDTDWYASTRHELEHLYPRLSPGGILIIDDYGSWEGARKATDDYVAEYAPELFFSRIDFSARMAVKIQ